MEGNNEKSEDEGQERKIDILKPTQKYKTGRDASMYFDGRRFVQDPSYPGNRGSRY
ncbi:MAG: hypothetical protein RLZZ283_64 [Candidatus Parcubacteria bacterium]